MLSGCSCPFGEPGHGVTVATLSSWVQGGGDWWASQPWAQLQGKAWILFTSLAHQQSDWKRYGCCDLISLIGSLLVVAAGYCVCVCKNVCVPACPGGLCVIMWRWEQQSDVKESRESGHILPSHCFSLSASHVMLTMLLYHCFGSLVLGFFCIFITACSTAFLWLSPYMSCDITPPSHNKTYQHYRALGTVSYFLCLSVYVSSCLWLSVLCCSLVVVLSLHAPDRWICVLWGCVHRGLTGKALQFSPGSAHHAGLSLMPSAAPTHLRTLSY